MDDQPSGLAAIASVFGVRSYSQEEVAAALNVSEADIEKQRAEAAAAGQSHYIVGSPAAPDEPMPAAPPAEPEEEKICRYCFDDDADEPLISPCACKGGQKWVHLACLRKWQRLVLVSQPTHPRFYADDPRHHTCNVCKAAFTCAPPTRLELMSSFTGPELGALIQSECVIGSHQTFSEELEAQLEQLGGADANPYARSLAHWARGVYLIHTVEPAQNRFDIPLDSTAHLRAIASRLDDDLTMTIDGDALRLVAVGSAGEFNAAGVPTEGEDVWTSEPEHLRAAVAPDNEVPIGGAPLILRFEKVDAPGCGEDHVTAVNLARPAPDNARRARVVTAALDALAKKHSNADVKVEQYVGGPCNDREIACCVVPGGRGCGWTVVQTLEEGLELAHSRTRVTTTVLDASLAMEAAAVRGGQTVRLAGLQARPDLNGEIGVALRFVEKSRRWEVRLSNGEGKQLKPANLEPLSHAGGRVLAFWGDAQWSRTQLLGEIARGHWGLCRASVAELTADVPERWAALTPRLVFAPETEMMEDSIRESRRHSDAGREMQRQRDEIERAGLLNAEEPGGGEDDA